jgi:hypothetical protein
MFPIFDLLDALGQTPAFIQLIVDEIFQNVSLPRATLFLKEILICTRLPWLKFSP